MRSPISFVILLTSPLVMVLAGCVVEDATPEVVDVFPAAPEPATATSETDFVRATITRLFSLPDEEGNTDLLDQPVVTVVADPQTVAKLASFFDGMGEGKESDLAAGWEEFAEITFLRSSGDEAPVSVSFTLEEWSEGQGDWPLPEEFETFFLKLLRADERSRQ